MRKAGKKLPWFTWKQVGTGIMIVIIFEIIMFIYSLNGF